MKTFKPGEKYLHPQEGEIKIIDVFDFGCMCYSKNGKGYFRRESKFAEKLTKLPKTYTSSEVDGIVKTVLERVAVNFASTDIYQTNILNTPYEDLL